MFKRLFVRKHEIEVLKYIKAVYEKPVRDEPESESSKQGKRDTETRYSLKAKATPPDLDIKEEKSRRDSGVRYSMDIEVTLDDLAIGKKKEKEPYKRYPRSIGEQLEIFRAVESHEVKHSDRASAKEDSFDAATVAATMSAYLNEQMPKKPLSAATNLTFVQMVQGYMRKKKLVETQVYKAALMDRRLFSKIMCDVNYKPSKDTAIALIFALKLSIAEARDLLERAGYTLSHSIRRDIMIEYFIKEGIYNLDNINAFLYNMYEKIIGRNV